ncbi:MAG: hypothetical protein NTZ55_05315 [Candidatus Roizmanbacteria bacterium]|nr:hypothetical protein [Candidatus Roizmanbacteria bacterium]
MDTYVTKDFYLSSVCLASKLQLIQIIRNNSGIATFVFANPNHIAESTIQKHWNKELKINSLDLVEAINQIKTRIHSGV